MVYNQLNFEKIYKNYEVAAVEIKQSRTLLKLLGLAGLLVSISACSSDPSPWTKDSSPWDQRRSSDVEAPAAEEYKSDLEMQSDVPIEVENTYEPEPVEVTEAEMMAEPEPVIEDTNQPASIMDHPAGYYTVQLMASVDIDRVYRFAEQNQITAEYVVPTERDGVTWHVLLLGIYPNYASAAAAKDEIAGSLATQPWIRKVGAVQKLVQ